MHLSDLSVACGIIEIYFLKKINVMQHFTFVVVVKNGPYTPIIISNSLRCKHVKFFLSLFTSNIRKTMSTIT